ncbi:hypothetical protein NQ176_g6074 [Zarea fungicola]|uniref:Uncharacterized protein n=1 Tax=Zarea fungicola TaxID=93591 RepID=A0ACC1N6B7_9HYPO|nr:hypothetical protein NQ176_g6074 [Lecanicillium fungicola]
MTTPSTPTERATVVATITACEDMVEFYIERCQFELAYKKIEEALNLVETHLSDPLEVAFRLSTLKMYLSRIDVAKMIHESDKENREPGPEQ